MDPPAPTTSSLAFIEHVPEIHESVASTDWSAVAARQLASSFSDQPEARAADIARLAQTYNLDNFDDVLEDPLCAHCGAAALKRCSSCRLDWYCGRDCQVAAWPKHKTMCQMLAEDAKQRKEERRTDSERLVAEVQQRALATASPAAA